MDPGTEITQMVEAAAASAERMGLVPYYLYRQKNIAGNFENVDTQIAGLGRIEAVEQLYVDHTKAAIDSIGSTDESADSDAAADTEADSAEDSAE